MSNPQPRFGAVFVLAASGLARLRGGPERLTSVAMRRRLPLLGVPASAEPAPAQAIRDEARVGLGPWSIGLADTGSGLCAAELAVQLVTVWACVGVPVALVLLGYQGVPALPAGLTAQLAALDDSARRCARVRVAAYGIDAGSEPAVPHGLAIASGEVALWVGLPALCSFAPGLGLLLGADRPLLQWPEPLRARRPRCQLELSQNRPGLAAALVSALNEHGFLPRR